MESQVAEERDVLLARLADDADALDQDGLETRISAIPGALNGLERPRMVLSAIERTCRGVSNAAHGRHLRGNAAPFRAEPVRHRGLQPDHAFAVIIGLVGQGCGAEASGCGDSFDTERGWASARLGKGWRVA